MTYEYQSEQHKNGVLTIRYENITEGWESWVCLISDAHWDANECNRSELYDDLNRAVDRNAPILSNGDWFDLMQGRFDPRRSMEGIRPEHRRDDYYDVVIDDCVEWCSPFANNIEYFGKGNHESSVKRNASIDPTRRFARNLTLLRTDGGTTHPGGYAGWVVFRFTIGATMRSSLKMKIHHGKGGSAPVTKGAIDTNRMAVIQPDADIVWLGHNHNAYIIPLARENISHTAKNITRGLQWHIRTPGYHDSWIGQSEGFAIEKGEPKPLGCAWLHFRYFSNSVKVTPILDLR